MVLAHTLVAGAGCAIGLTLAVWTAYGSAPWVLIAVEDRIVRSVHGIRRLVDPRPALESAVLESALGEIKLRSLPPGHFYHPLPSPESADWDQPGNNSGCQLQSLAGFVPLPVSKSPYYDVGRAISVDELYGAFLHHVNPPEAGAEVAKEVFTQYLQSKRSMQRLRRELRREATGEDQQRWADLQRNAERQYLELAKQLQAMTSATASVYGQAWAAYLKEGNRQTIYCDGRDERVQGYSTEPPLQTLRTADASRTTIASVAELVRLANPGSLGQDGAQSLGAVDADVSFAQARILRIVPGEWFTRDALRDFAGRLRPDSPKFWGDDGVFPLMPVGLLVATNPNLKLKLSPSQAVRLRELMARSEGLQVGNLRFRFDDGPRYSAFEGGNAVITEMNFAMKSSEVVILGVITMRPDAQ